MRFVPIVIATLLGFTAFAVGPAAQAAESTVEVVVEFAPGSTADDRAAALDDAGARLLEYVGPDFALVEAAASAVDVGGAVTDVDATVPVRATGVPTDPYFRHQWHLDKVQASRAWDVATGVGVVVAVVDTGVRATAPDLAGVRYVAPRDWVDGDLVPTDENGHGTHVTGTIAQTTNDGYGTAGLAHGATIMPLRALDEAGQGTDAHVAAAIHHAVANGADVINLSLGADRGSSVLADAVAAAAAAGVVVVAATGNTGDAAVGYPAAYDSVIAVGAVDETLARAPFSAYGPAVDLAAPGTRILQQTFTSTGWCFCTMSGTSSATPQVAAAAALLLDAGVPASGVRDRLLRSALDVAAPGRDDATGAGVLQVADALALASDPAPTAPTAPVTAIGEPEDGAGAVAPDSGTATPTTQDVDDACPASVPATGLFADVDPASVHARTIDCVARLGFATGVAPGLFAPAVAVSRAQMATFLARTLARSGVTLPLAPPNAFADDDTSPHAFAIDQLAAIGVLRGTGVGTYSPQAPVSRAAMASFLVAVHDRAATMDLGAGNDFFGDDEGSVHEAAIDRLAAAGIATGTAPRQFSPSAPVVRGQLATFLARTFDALVDAGDAAAP